MIQDLHSHTYYSFCGEDKPEVIAEAAIAGGVELFGICDHNYGVGFGQKAIYKSELAISEAGYVGCLERYFDHINLIKEAYEGRLRVLRGLEIATSRAFPRRVLPDRVDVSFFDYCLLENLSEGEGSVIGGDLFGYAERLGCPWVGIAHTDLFAYITRIGEDPYRYFRRMAEQGIFWEMNVNLDSIHGYREHAYVHRFFADAEQQAVVRESGVRLSVGFDGHRVGDYLPDRVADACRRLTAMGIKLAFES